MRSAEYSPTTQYLYLRAVGMISSTNSFDVTNLMRLIHAENGREFTMQQSTY